jgi:hypothetical protein
VFKRVVKHKNLALLPRAMLTAADHLVVLGNDEAKVEAKAVVGGSAVGLEVRVGCNCLQSDRKKGGYRRARTESSMEALGMSLAYLSRNCWRI